MRGNSHPTSKLPPGSSLIVRKTPPWWSCGAVTSSERPLSLILLAGSPPRKRGRRPFTSSCGAVIPSERPSSLILLCCGAVTSSERLSSLILLAGSSPLKRGRRPFYFELRGRHHVKEAVVPYTSCEAVALPSPRQRGRRPLYFLRGRHLVREAVVPFTSSCGAVTS